jgi:hypothetical protein
MNRPRATFHSASAMFDKEVLAQEGTCSGAVILYPWIHRITEVVSRESLP